jgi:hypothetical protein
VGSDCASWPHPFISNFPKPIVVLSEGEQPIRTFSPQFTLQFLKMQIPEAEYTKQGIQ